MIKVAPVVSVKSSFTVYKYLMTTKPPNTCRIPYLNIYWFYLHLSASILPYDPRPLIKTKSTDKKLGPEIEIIDYFNGKLQKLICYLNIDGTHTYSVGKNVHIWHCSNRGLSLCSDNYNLPRGTFSNFEHHVASVPKNRIYFVSSFLVFGLDEK